MDWPQVGSTQAINLATRVYVGMAVVADCCNWGFSASALFDNVWVNIAPDFYPIPIPALWASSIAGDVGHYQIGVGGLDGFNGLVGLSVTGLPAGATASISPSVIGTERVADIAIQAPSGTPVGTYPLMINVTGGGQTHSVPVQLNVVNGASGSLPAGWVSYSLGARTTSSSYANGVYTLSSDADTNTLSSLGGTSDGQSNFVAQPMLGDGTIQARITGVQGIGNSWVGVLLRTGPSASAADAFVGSLDGAVTFGWRSDTSANMTVNAGPRLQMPYWVRLVRSDQTVSAYYSLNGVDWTQLGTSQTVTMGTLLYTGLMLSPHFCCGSTTATFDEVSLANSGGIVTPDFAVSVPSGSWNIDAGESLEITTSTARVGGFNGPVALAASGLPAGVTASFSPAMVTGTGTSILTLNTSASTPAGSYVITVNGIHDSSIRSANVTFTVNGAPALPVAAGVTPSAGTGASGTFGFTLTDPTNVSNIDWVEALVSSSLNGLNACYMHFDVASNTVYLRDDVAPQWIGSGTLGSTVTLANSQCSANLAASSVANSGNSLTLNLALTFTPAFAGIQNLYLLGNSGDLNSGWTEVGSWTIPVPGGSLPAGWVSYPLGGRTTSSSYANGVYTVSSDANTDTLSSLGGTADGQTNFVAQPMLGDGTVQARITGMQGIGNSWVGVMLRTGPSASAADAFVGSVDGAVSFGWRPDTSANMTVSAGPSLRMPYWVRLVRSGQTVSGYYSLNGVDWTQVGTSQTITMGTLLYTGLVLSPHFCCGSTTATFDNVSISTVPDFYFVPSVNAQAAGAAGGMATFRANVGIENGLSTVALGVSGLPSGISATFNPASITAGQSVDIILQVADDTPLGTYPFMINGTAGALVHSMPAELVVTESSAIYVKTDTTTQGSWQGVYGADGYNVIDATAAYPSYVAVTPSGQSNYIWNSSTSDARALQKSASSTDRIAATWYSGGIFNLDLNFNDVATHQVAVYCLDWDGNGSRAETIDILDGASNTVLDSRQITNFSGGQYLVWNVSRHVKVRFTNASPSWNAVVSGWFFDTP